MNEALINLKTIISQNYRFYYKNKLIENKAQFKEAILNGLMLQCLLLEFSQTSYILFDLCTCEYNQYELDYFYWLSFENVPNELIWDELQYQYIYRNN